MVRKKNEEETAPWMMCPFCNREVAIVEVAPDSQGACHYQVRSVHGWSSRLFTSKEFAENWLKTRNGEMIAEAALRVTGMKTPFEQEAASETIELGVDEAQKEASRLVED